jgi:hypothetical protein
VILTRTATADYASANLTRSRRKRQPSHSSDAPTNTQAPPLSIELDYPQGC